MTPTVSLLSRLRALVLPGAAALLLTTASSAVTPQASCVLTADTHQVSVSSGGRQLLTIQTSAGGALWQMLGSASGDTPGHLFMGVTPVALNVDRYFAQTFNGRNRLLRSDVGVSDAAGIAHNAVVVPPGATALVGTTLHHAFFVLNPLTLLPDCASNSVAIRFVP